MSELTASRLYREELVSQINKRCITCRPLIIAAVSIAEVAISAEESIEKASDAFDRLLDDDCVGPRPDDEVASCSTPNCSHIKGATFLVKAVREIKASNDINAAVEE